MFQTLRTDRYALSKLCAALNVHQALGKDLSALLFSLLHSLNGDSFFSASSNLTDVTGCVLNPESMRFRKRGSHRAQRLKRKRPLVFFSKGTALPAELFQQFHFITVFVLFCFVFLIKNVESICVQLLSSDTPNKSLHSEIA